jgi:PAS domain S-box-containing protein
MPSSPVLAISLRRYLTRLVLLSLLPLLALSAWLALTHYQDELAAQRREAQGLADNLADEVDRYLSDRIKGLQLLASSPTLDDQADLPRVHRQLLAYQQAFGSAAMLADLEHRYVAHSSVPAGQALPAQLPQPRGRSAYELVLRHGQPAVGDLFQGPLAREPMVALGVPVARDHALHQVLLGLVAASQLQQQLDNLSVPPGWRIDLTDGSGQLLAGQGPRPADDQPLLQFDAAVSSAPWRVRLQAPPAARWNPSGHTVVSLALLVLGATVAGLLAGSAAGRRLGAAVRSLAQPQREAPAGPAGAAPPQPEPDRTADIAEIAAVRERLREAAAQRDAAALAQQLSEARLRGIIESASEAILTVDAEQRIVVANPAAARMYGWTAQQLLGQPLSLLVPPAAREHHQRLVQHFIDSEAPARQIGTRPGLVGVRANGEEFPIEAGISQVHVDGQRLATVIVHDITALRRAQLALEASHAELRRLLAAQDQVQEDERKRIARELHDELQQTLAAIRMEAGVLAVGLPAALPSASLAGPPDAPDLAAMVARVDELAASAMASTRRIVNDLRPQMLEDLGLAAALQALGRQFQQRTGLTCTVACPPEASPAASPAPQVATCLYRVAQEALQNVSKHARAHQVQVRLAEEGAGGLLLSVQDDGIGLDEADRRKPRAFGLLGMEERVRAVGGQLRVQSAPSQGCCVQVSVPAPAAT